MKYNNSQLEAIDHISGPCLVLAGAGSGKTRVITGRIENLINNHKIKPSTILAVTEKMLRNSVSDQAFRFILPRNR